MADFEATSFPLPEVQKALSPYVKTRHEALQIRRTLTAYLGSQIEGPEGTEASGVSPLLLAAGVTSVKDTPEDVTGMRRDYLEALKANVTARKRYAALVTASPTEEVADVTEERNNGSDVREPLHDYLALLKLRKRQETIKILHRYSETLTRKAAEDSIDRDPRDILAELPSPPESPVTNVEANERVNDQSKVDELLGRLETAVLRAKHMHDTEKRRLEVLKADTTIPENIDSRAHLSRKVIALGRTRNELIGWIEGELGKAASEPEPAVVSDPPQPEEFNIEQALQDVRCRYEDYTKTRKDLIETVSAPDPARTSDEQPDAPDGLSTQDIDSPTLSNEAAYLSQVLPYLEHHLLPMANERKVLIQQKSHLASTLAKQQLETRQALERLADESHLLSSYPLLAGQPRFENAVAALAPHVLDKQAAAGKGGETPEAAECLEKIRAWAFASESAATATRDHVSERLDSGRQSLSSAQGLLDEIRIVLGQTDDGWRKSMQAMTIVSGPREHRRASETPTPRSGQREDREMVECGVGLMGGSE